MIMINLLAIHQIISLPKRMSQVHVTKKKIMMKKPRQKRGKPVNVYHN